MPVLQNSKAFAICNRMKALEAAIFDLRNDESAKNWKNVDECLQVSEFLCFHKKTVKNPGNDRGSQLSRT